MGTIRTVYKVATPAGAGSASSSWRTWVGRQDRWDLVSKGLIVLLAILILFTFVDYGITWDEPVQHYYGRMIVRYYFVLLHGHYDTNAVNFAETNLYGGLFDTIAAMSAAVSPLGDYETRHLLNALVGLLGIVGCWKVARLIGGPRAGFWAVVLIALTPRYYGEMFNNPKDIPFAAGYIWSLYFLLRAMGYLPRVPRDLVIKLGIAIGMTLGVRVGGLLLLAYLFMVVGMYALIAARSRAAFAGLTRFMLGSTAIAWAIMLIFWPWAQVRPFTRPFEALSHFTHFPWYGSVLFDGRIMKATQEPRTYILRWLSITLPEIILLLTAVGLVYGIVMLFRKRTYISATSCYYGLLSFAVLFPLMYAVATKAVLYDADRHFLYVVPPLVCLAALNLSRVNEWLRHGHPVWANGAIVVLGAYLLSLATVMVRLHPDEYVYFNQTIGGLPGAYRKFDTDYWGNSYREAVKALDAHLKQTEGGAGSYKVMAVSKRESSNYYFPPNLTFTKKPEEADFIIATTRDRLNEMLDGNVILTIDRFGVPLAFVKDRRQLKGVPVPGWPPLLMTQEP